MKPETVEKIRKATPSLRLNVRAFSYAFTKFNNRQNRDMNHNGHSSHDT